MQNVIIEINSFHFHCHLCDERFIEDLDQCFERLKWAHESYETILMCIIFLSMIPFSIPLKIACPQFFVILSRSKNLENK